MWPNQYSPLIRALKSNKEVKSMKCKKCGGTEFKYHGITTGGNPRYRCINCRATCTFIDRRGRPQTQTDRCIECGKPKPHAHNLCDNCYQKERRRLSKMATKK